MILQKSHAFNQINKDFLQMMMVELKKKKITKNLCKKRRNKNALLG